MKKFIIAAIFLSVSVLMAQSINGRFSSSIYTFERYDSTNSSTNYLRTFQTLYLNINKSNYALKTRLNFEGDIANPLKSDPRLRFYNLYFEARNLFDVATVRLGRQSLFNSVAGGVYDGVNLRIKHGIFKIEGFYGGNVPAYQKLELTDDLSNDYVLGGEVTLFPTEELRIALNYTNKNFKAQNYDAERMNAYNVLDTIFVQKASNEFRFVGAEVSYNLDNVLDINTKYNYDLNFLETSKFELSGRYSQIDNLGISFYYNYREPKVRYNSIFSVFNYGNTQEVEGGLDYRFSNAFTVYGKYGTVIYKDDNSQRLTVGANTAYGSISYRKTFGYAGELDAVSLYTARTFFDGFLTPSIGVTYTKYRLSESSPQNDLFAFLGGVNVRPWKQLSFDLQGQFLTNKIYKDDFRILFKINHWFNTNLDWL